MQKIITLLLFFIPLFLLGQAENPSIYYNGFNWNQTGMTLKSALATKITTTHTNILNYDEAEEAIRIVDLDPEDTNNNNVLLVYGFSNNICPSSSSDDNDHRRRNKEDDGGGSNCQWNREHTYPRSLGTPDLGSSGPGADAHHLRASDVQRNGDRGSEKFAAGSGNSQDITSSTWYPGDEWKGDIARMMMYMYLRYPTRCLPKNVGVGNLLSNDDNMIDLFLTWNAEDPVSTVEDQRNSYLGNANNNYGQGNRNPFIDNPYLATLIWGGTPAENRWPSIFLSSVDFNVFSNVVVYPNPSDNHIINIQTTSNIDLIELITINGRLVKQIKNPILENNTFTLNNLPQGFYFLKLTLQNQSITKKVIVN